MAPPSAAKPQPTPETQQREGEEVIRITTSLVQVDAVVTDDEGRLVTDLKPEEIQIFEDGRPRKVTHLSYIPAAVSAHPTGPPATDGAAPPATPRPREARRTIALVVDDLGLSAQSIEYVRRALKKFVDEQMQPGELVAIIKTSGGVSALQQFTSDRRQLYVAIEGVKWFAGGRSGVSPLTPIEPPIPGRFGAQIMAKQTEQNRLREDLFAVGTLGALSYVVRGLRELPGRKSVLLISDGFRITNSDDPTRSDRVSWKLRQLVDEASRAAVVIHTMNASGLKTTSLSAADSMATDTSTGARSSEETVDLLTGRGDTASALQVGLSQLAAQTGGIAVRNTNDLASGVRRALNDESGYYLIGYSPDSSTFDPRAGRGLFHRLSIKVTRPGKFYVRMRHGFFGVPNEGTVPAALSAQDQITKALLSPFGAPGVRVRLTSLFADDPQDGPYTRSILYVNAGDLTFTEEPEGWRKATFDVVAVTFDESGNVIDQLSRTDSLRVRDATYRQVLDNGFVYFVVFPVKKPGAYQLRAALRDHGSERIGSAGQFVEIPDLKKGRLALSGLVVRGVDRAEAVGAAPDGGDAGQADPRVSEAVRQFKTGMVMRYSLVIYNARMDKATGSPQLQVQARLFRDGRLVFTGKVQPFAINHPPDLRRLAAEGAVTLGADMALGAYVLQVTVTDLLADEKNRSASQWMDFEIMR